MSKQANLHTIQLCSLSIGYAGKKQTKVVAQDINASIHGGELTCLLGANGAGKSTLLRTLSAFQPKLNGQTRVMGKEIGLYTDKELATIIGVVLTDRCDVRNMTVEELVGMGRSPYTGFWGRLRGRDREIVKESISLVKIENLTHRMVHTLSDGERQKVMIAKALAQQTSLIILDEPTAFLDFPSKVETLQMLRRLAHEQHKSILLSTHDVELALQIADQLWLMEENHLSIGTPKELAEDGSLSRFIDRDGISFDVEKMRVELSSTFS